MITNLRIENFRSIHKVSLDLGRFTILNGANNSGKSSVLYAAQVLKNVITNPQRSKDELFNLGFLNLGGLDGAVNKSFGNDLEISITTQKKDSAETETIYVFGIDRSSSFLRIEGIKPFDFGNSLELSFPYTLNKTIPVKVKGHPGFLWNGFDAQPIQGGKVIPLSLRNQVSYPIQSLMGTDLIPTIRGFTKPIFNDLPLNGLHDENQIASLLATDPDLQAKVSHYFEHITGSRFSVSPGPLKRGYFYLRVQEKNTEFATELVNQGMGMNQIVFMLTKILYKPHHFICIDEPEIHLHPTLIERFVKVLIEIAEKEDKQFIFSTHSEHWLLSMLAEVNDGNLKADDLKVYYLYKDGQETKIENQAVQPNGQIEGGLRNFLDAEMHLTQRFLD